MKTKINSNDANLLKSLSVLYVEDDPIVASHTVSLLEGLCRKVFHCGSAEEALELLKNEEIHIVINDIELPGMSGLQLSETIRKENNDIPILITTVHENIEMLRNAVRLNLVDYLIKPVNPSSLADSLQEALQRIKKNGTMMVEISNDVRYLPMCGKLVSKGNDIALTHSEIALLNLLVRHQNQVIAQDSIEYLLHPEEPMSESAFKNLLYRLRKKIGKESIVSVPGIGIKFCVGLPVSH